MKKNQKGFSIVEFLLIIVILAILGFLGWYVWNQRKNKTVENNKTSETSQTKTNAKKPDSEITNGPGAEWNTYTNNKIGFSIQIPKKFMSGNGADCQEVKYVYDNYGNKVSSPAHFVPAQGLVPATLVQNSNDFYVTEEYTFQPTDKTDDGVGHQLAGACKKVQTTIDSLKEYGTTGATYLSAGIPFTVLTAKSEQDILKWAKNTFKDDSVTIASTKDNSSGSWQDVALDCTSSNPCTTFNFKFYLRYYKKQNKMVYFQQGQSGHIQKSDSQSFYDKEIVNSFKLL